MERVKVLCSLSALMVVPLVADAEMPQVQFDIPYSVACRDVTPPDYAATHGDQKLIEAKLQISSLLTAGDEKDLLEYFIRIESPRQTFSIVDYMPKTAHEKIASKMTTEKSTDHVAALGINLSGKYELLTLPGPSAGVGVKKTSSVKTELLPPVETVAASGTLLRGSALFFKIKSTPRNLLEGTREYGLVISVPTAWRADYVRIRCEAEGIRRNLVSTFDEQVQCGRRDFVVALYLDGDESARQLAENFARREAAKSSHDPKLKAPARTTASVMGAWDPRQR